jgi:hypothetical protein
MSSAFVLPVQRQAMLDEDCLIVGIWMQKLEVVSVNTYDIMPELVLQQQRKGDAAGGEFGT